MTSLNHFRKSQLKAVLSAETEEQMFTADNLQNNAREVLNVPVTLVTAWPYVSDFPQSGYDYYAYCHIRINKEDRIVRVGGNAGRQALWLESKGLLPSVRMLCQVDRVYFWKRA